MTIIGLENNYYLALNEIWISIKDITSNASYLELTVTNLTTGVTLHPLTPAPSPTNEFFFNICIPVRYMFPEVNHINVNTLQAFKFDFKVKFEDTTIPDDTLTLEKYFVFGGRDKNGTDEWYLSDYHELLVGKWIKWKGVDIPGFANKIQNNTIVSFIPNEQNIFTHNFPGCDYKIIKFLNSLGGYQYYIFEKYQIKKKTKANKIIEQITDRLRKDNFRNTGTTIDKSIELETKTPFQIQEVFSELVSSMDVYMYDSNGNDNDSHWIKLVLENNDSIENNYTQQYENKIEFSFSNNIKRKI